MRRAKIVRIGLVETHEIDEKRGMRGYTLLSIGIWKCESNDT